MKNHLSRLAVVTGMALAGSAFAVPVTTGGFTYEFIDFSGGTALAPGPGCGPFGGDYRCNQMHFDAGVGGDLAVTATRGGAEALVVQELPQWNGGLGVAAESRPNRRTWVGPGEVLKLSFENLVNLVGYHVYQVGNAPGADHFQVSTDEGAHWATRSFASVVFTPANSNQWLTGTESLWFRAEDKERFYLGAVKITSAVPEPASALMLVAGLTALALATRRSVRAAGRSSTSSRAGARCDETP